MKFTIRFTILQHSRHTMPPYFCHMREREREREREEHKLQFFTHFYFYQNSETFNEPYIKSVQNNVQMVFRGTQKCLVGVCPPKLNNFLDHFNTNDRIGSVMTFPGSIRGVTTGKGDDPSPK